MENDLMKQVCEVNESYETMSEGDLLLTCLFANNEGPAWQALSRRFPERVAHSFS